MFVAVAIGAASALYGSERAASREKLADRVTVTYWEKWNGEEAQAMQRIVDKFNRSQNRIYVRLLSISGIAEKTLLATSGGNPPDIAGLWGDQVVQFADQHALTDLTELAREYGVKKSDYITPYWDELNYSGKLYALPSTPGCNALFVNRDLMPQEYNSPDKFPKTLSEFEKMVAKVSVVESGQVKVAGFLPRQGFGSGSWPYLFGASYISGKNVDVSSPNHLKAWKWVHSYAERYGVRETQSFTSGFGNYSSPQNPFLSGKLATLVEGVWFSHFIKQYNPKIRWFAVPFPYPDGRPDLAGYTVLNLNTVLIPKGAKHPKEAFEFLAFLQEQENMEQLCRDQQCNSPLSNVSDEFLHHNPNPYIAVFDQLARSKRAMAPPKVGIWNQISQEVGTAVDKLDLGQMTAEAALKDAQTRVDNDWAKYQEQVMK